MKAPWNIEIYPLSLYHLPVPDKTRLPLHRGVLLISDWRSKEVNCVVVLSFLGQLCTDDAQHTVTGFWTSDIPFTAYLSIYLFYLFLCYPCNWFCPGLHFFIWPSENCLQLLGLLCQASALSLIIPRLHSSVLCVVFPLLKALAIIPGLYFSASVC